MKIFKKTHLFVTLFFILVSFHCAYSAAGNDVDATVDQILSRLEKRFSVSGFSADFYQESPLQDIGIIESAAGKAYFKKTDKFRWEYTTPDPLHYISDGKKLWIHSPEDNNVWVGETDYFFGKESSASFLTDVSQIRKKFHVEKSSKQSETEWILLLVPSADTGLGINKIFLSISKETGNITKITSFNMSNAETRISFSNYNFSKTPDNTLFGFKIPKNANIIPLQ